ncbi:MAG: hypothetical protein U0T36_03260 [Saprospiraceae bacterium]
MAHRPMPSIVWMPILKLAFIRSGRTQMMEAVHVAAAIKGGATLVNAVPMMNTKSKLMQFYYPS